MRIKRKEKRTATTTHQKHSAQTAKKTDAITKEFESMKQGMEMERDVKM